MQHVRLTLMILWVILLVVNCSGRVAKEGDTVSVHYHGTLDNGDVFDSSRARGEPLSFTVGSGQMISGFDRAVVGMVVGEKKTIRLEPDQAYGERRDDLTLDIPRDQAPEGLSVGDRVGLSTGGQAVVLGITDETIRIDANHPLAGTALTFEIELVSIQ